MEDIRPKGAWYAVYLDTPVDFKSPVVDVNKLAECLPHGSGIDGDWTISVKRNGDITVHGEYHAMNEHSYYAGWRNFRFSLRRATRSEYHKLFGPCAGKYQVTYEKGQVYFQTFVGGGDAADYLYDTCYCAVSNYLGMRSISTRTVDESQVPVKYRK